MKIKKILMGLMVFGGLMTIPNLAVAAPAGKESVEIKKYDTLNAAAEDYAKVLQEIKLLKNKIEPWRDLVKTCEDLETLYELAAESADDGLEDEISQTFNKAKENYEKYSILNLLSDEVDKNSAFLSIHSGAGGTEANGAEGYLADGGPQSDDEEDGEQRGGGEDIDDGVQEVGHAPRLASTSLFAEIGPLPRRDRSYSAARSVRFRLEIGRTPHRNRSPGPRRRLHQTFAPG